MNEPSSSSPWYRINCYLIPVKITYFCGLAGVASLLPYIPVFFKQAGLTPDAAAIIYGFMAFMGAALRPFFGWLADKFRQHKLVLILCCLLTGPLHGCMLLVQNSSKQIELTPLNITLKCQPYNLQFEFCPTDVLNNFNCKSIRVNSTSLAATSPNPLPETSDCIARCEHTAESFEVCMNSVCSRRNGTFQIKFLNTSVALMSWNVDESNEMVTKFWCTYNATDILYDNNGYNSSSFSCGSTVFTRCSPLCPHKVKMLENVTQIETSKELYGMDCQHKYSKWSSVFWKLAIIFFLGQVFFSPIFNLIDGITYHYLGEQRSSWGLQRLWGTVGFAIFAVISTYIMDVAAYSADEKNFLPAFIMFIVLNIFAGISVATYKLTEEDDKDMKIKRKNIKQALCRLDLCVLLVAVFTFGIHQGVVEMCLFWFLHDLNAPQVLLGLTLLTNCIPEILIFIVSGYLIRKTSQELCLYSVFVACVIRLAFYSLVTNPWFVLFIEPLHSLTFGLMYATSSSYISQRTPSELQSTAQGILAGTYFGLGKGAGVVVAGVVYQLTGPRIMFRSFAAFMFISFVAFLMVQELYFKRSYKAPKMHMVTIDKATPDNETSKHLAMNGQGDVKIIDKLEAAEESDQFLNTIPI